MMYRREGQKPVRELGFILPLIGCGCLYRGRSFNSGRSAPRICAVNITALNPSSFFSFFWVRKRLSVRRERLPLPQYGSLVATIMEAAPGYLGEWVRLTAGSWPESGELSSCLPKKVSVWFPAFAFERPASFVGFPGRIAGRSGSL